MEEPKPKSTWPVWTMTGALALLVFGVMFGGLDLLLKNERARAEQRYRSVAGSGTAAEKCTAAGRVRAAHLEAADSDGYKRWTMQERQDCLHAELDAAAAAVGGGE